MIVDRFKPLQLIKTMNDFETVDNFIYLGFTITMIASAKTKKVLEVNQGSNKCKEYPKMVEKV